MSTSALDIIVLTGCPISPSTNTQYASFVRHGRMVRVLSKDFVAYRTQFSNWVLQNKEQILAAQETIRLWDKPLSVTMIVAFDSTRLVTKDGRMKANDATNRVKATHDLLAAALGIDDKIFVSCPVEKVTRNNDEPEQVVFIIRPHPLRKLSDIIYGDEGLCIAPR